MTVNRLFLRKLGVAFLVGAAPPVLAFITTVGPTGGYHFTKAALFSLATGALSAGVRAAFQLLPGLNLVPSDAQPILTKTAEAGPPAPKK